VVEVRDVVRTFGKTVALDGVTLDVNDGELFGLVGPDGAGKTTLFRILTSLMLPTSGSATVLGFDVTKDLWQIRSRVGYMPGGFSLYPDLSVIENLEFFAAVFGTTVEEGYELIAPIYKQIEPFRDRRAEALSGGMKQKLALSCALVHRPQLLFLDEPTTGVDAVSRREFWDQLETLRSTGLAIVASTPYMDEAMRCDRIALLHGGKMLGIDTPLRIGKRFEHSLVSVKGAARYQMLRKLRENPHVHSVYLFGDTLHFADSRAGTSAEQTAHEVEAWLHANGHADATAQPIEPGIEDSFMSLMSSAVSAA
jgi:ABC-type multidrug transport system ATPase subunit